MPDILESQSNKYKLLAPAVLTCIWFVMILFVRPVGDFPLNDDWSYGRAVYWLVEQGSVQFPHWVAMPLIAQVLWGAVFCAPFGFSFTALRFSTLILGLAGVLATYCILREIKAGKLFAVVAALLIAVNPLYFVLSNTFMTDVPFYALAMLSLLFFIRAIARQDPRHIIAGTILACVATLIRQVGIVIPVCFAIAFLVKNRLNRKTVVTALLPALCALAVYIGYSRCLELTVGLPHLYNLQITRLLSRLTHPSLGLLKSFVDMTICAALYLGLFLLPLLIMAIPGRWLAMTRREKTASILVFADIFVLTILFLIFKGRLMPLSINVLYDIGLGPPTLYDVYILKLPNLPCAPRAVWVTVTFAAVVGAALLAENIISLLPRLFSGCKEPSNGQSNKPLIAFVLSACVFYFGPLGIIGLLDRYLIFLMPLLMAAVACSMNRIKLDPAQPAFLLVCPILVVLAIFTVAATHDYLSWNKVRWKALDYLVEEKHVSPRRIDGGFEFNGWHYDSEYPEKPTRWWWVYQDDYVVSFGPIPGYEQVKAYNYDRYIPPGQGRILILHKAVLR